MSSLSLELENFTLSQEMQNHQAAVRALDIFNEKLISVGFDCKAYLHERTQNAFQLISHFNGGNSYLYSVKFRKDGLACFTGEQSGTINHLDLSGNLIATFTGHSSTVCSLECTDTELLSGSWDATAKLWDINTGNCTVTISSEHHQHGVTARFASFGIITGSQNGKINFWDKTGQLLKSFKAHDDIIRDIKILDNGNILTCSNDSLIKIWSNEGNLMQTIPGHQGYVFAIYEFAGFIISASDDKTVKVWNNDTCIDTILHPNSIFSIVCTWDNDIVTACGDCYTRVFTKNEQRMANLDIIDKFNKNVEDSHKPMTANDFSDAPSIEQLPFIKGEKDQAYKVFLNNGTAEAYMWHQEGEFWERIGEVMGAPDDTVQAPQNQINQYYSGDHVFQAGTYDYVFDVEIGGVYKKLPFNGNQNPLEVAERFVFREGINRGFVPQIAKHINDNAQPYAGGQQERAPVTPQVESRYFPYINYVFFDSCNTDPIVKKIAEFDTLQTEQNKLMDSEFKTLGFLCENLKGHKQLTAGQIELVKKLLRWNKEQLFPIFDLCRIIMLNPASQELFKSADVGQQIMLTAISPLQTHNDVPTLLSALRFVVNMFKFGSSLYVLQRLREQVIDLCINTRLHQHKGVRISLASLLFNYSVLFASKDDQEGRIQIIAALCEWISSENDEEIVLKLLTTLGNLFKGGNGSQEALQLAKDLGLAQTLQAKQFGGKSGECSRDLQLVLG